jgi:hypothetical protein
MSAEFRYKVVAPLVTVKTYGAIYPGHAGKIFQTIPYGGFLPSDVDREMIDHLLGIGMVEDVAPAGRVDA